jgi:Uma2 family endonuclease
MTAALVCRLIVRRATLHPEPAAEQIVSMPVIRQRRWTTEEVDRLIDERSGMSPRYELVDGELLVTPAPTHRHQRLILQLAVLLLPYLTRGKLGEIFLGPSELRLVNGERYEPDLFVVPVVEGRRPAMRDTFVRPLLICETLSPGSARHDRIIKRRSFQRNAVPDYWIIDADAQAFEIWHPDDERPALIDDRLVWRPPGATEHFELDIPSFFASVEDDAPLA